MVEFKDREDVKRWLERITPRQRQNDVSVTLAARAAMRALPLIVSSLGQPRRERGEATRLILHVFRTLALAWVAAKYSVKGDDFRLAANFATLVLANEIVVDGDPGQPVLNAHPFNTSSLPGVIKIDNVSFLTVSAALDAARTASVSAVTVPNEYPAQFAVLAIHNAINAAASAVAREVMGSGAGSASADDDASAIDSGISSARLAGSPLWLEGEPNPAERAWQRLKTALLSLNEGWEVWSDWYDARLEGDVANPPNEALEVARATIQDEIWKQGPAVLNAEIRRLIDEHEKGELAVDDPRASVATADDREHDKAAFAPILATRAALRALPLLAIEEFRPSDIAKSKSVFATFRALAVAWASVRYPDVVNLQWCVAAGRHVGGYIRGSELERHLAKCTADTAFATGSETSGAAAARAASAQIEAQHAMALASDRAAQVAARLANSSDADDVVAGVNPGQVAEVELWPGREPPPFLQERWNALKESLSAANEGWEVWIDWYEARLDGHVHPKEVELAYVEFIRNVVDSAPARVANAEIKRLIDLHTPKPPADLPQIESISEQERTGTCFGVDAHGRLDVVRIPPTTDELQRFHYDEMRHKAQTLAALGQMLGDVAPSANRILEALPERMEDASVDKLWSRANTLRRRHDAHVRAIENNLGPNPARLDDLVAATLGDFVDGFNVYVLGDPRAVELDSARLGPQDREAVRRIVALAAPIARAASEPQAPTTAAARDALTEQVEAAIGAPDDINGDQAADLARKTTGNFVSELLRQAYAPIAKLKAFAKDQPRAASKAMIEGFYREGGKKIFDAMPGAAGAAWRTTADFVVANYDSLKEFVLAQFLNPALIDIINGIKNLHDWLG